MILNGGIVVNNTNKKCKVCGAELILSKRNHYISRGCEVTGIASIAKREETKLYDTFDCVVCGCQNIMQERKRGLELEMNLPTSEELKEQDCFGYYQEYIDKCRKCSEKERCKVELDKEVPEDESELY